MSSKDNRIAIIALFESGKSPADIVKTLPVPRRTVYAAIKRYKELGTTDDRPRKGRPVTATTPENQNKLRHRIRRNPGKSMRKLAKEMKIGRESIRKMVRNNLKCRSYKLGMGHYLDERMKHVRLVNAQRLLKKKTFCSILFTDEKIFTVERAVNRQNDRQILRNSQGLFRIFCSFELTMDF